MGRKVNKNEFGFPPPQKLPGSNLETPHVLIGDEAFALKTTMMKPYSRALALRDQEAAVYNIRHTHARRAVEDSFGVLCARFRILFTPIIALPSTVDKIITCCCILHNIVISSRSVTATNGSSKTLNSIRRQERNINTVGNTSEYEIREKFKTYFSNEGALDWQYNTTS